MVPRFFKHHSAELHDDFHLSGGRGAVESFEGVSVQEDVWFKVSNRPFSVDLLLLAGSVVVPLCASGRVPHGVVGVLGRFWLTEQVARGAGVWQLRAVRCSKARYSEEALIRLYRAKLSRGVHTPTEGRGSKEPCGCLQRA